jgi:hypothetical protein
MPKKAKRRPPRKSIVAPRFSRNERQLLYWGLQALGGAPPHMGFLLERLKKRLIRLGAQPDQVKPKAPPTPPTFINDDLD